MGLPRVRRLDRRWLEPFEAKAEQEWPMELAYSISDFDVNSVDKGLRTKDDELEYEVRKAREASQLCACPHRRLVQPDSHIGEYAVHNSPESEFLCG